MKILKKKNRIIAGFLAVALALLLGAGFPAVEARAASGNVYTCAINRCYAHPVTGEIEDSGGEASYATGQGMVEGCVYADGILEVTDSGEYYLTIRMSLMDYTSDHSFWVQNVGDSSWSSPAMGQTGSGTDTNGTTADICIQVPSENCVVRGSMYVEPMGRYVIFYFYPSDYTAGNSTDMNATMVTSASGSDTSTNTSGSTTTSGSTSTTGSTSTGSSTTTSGSSTLQSSTLSSGSSSELQSSATDGTDSTESTDESTDSTAPALSSSITEAATPSTTTDSDDDTLDSAEGLSLSTEDAAASGDTATAETVTKTTPTKTIITWVAAVTVGILIVVAVVAIIVYFFRKNWSRWGGGEDDYEYEDE